MTADSNEWMNNERGRSLAAQLGDEPPQKVYPKRRPGFEDMLVNTFREGSKAANGAPEPPPVFRDEGDVAILNAAVRYAGEESNRRAITETRRAVFEARKMERAVTAELKESVEEKLRDWASRLTPEQVEAFPFSGRYAKLNDLARARIDKVLAEFAPEPEPPTPEELAAIDAELENEAEDDESGEFVYE